ncbi:Bro-N domain-containing protein [Terasakiella pusilla]|uniref:BRO-N domain-containing protein n=1 Tax=Terasakiella pusilla TaxID=64973 RepID=UPI003AA95FE0
MQSTAQVIPFDFEKHPVRVVIIDNDPWFVASDACAALGIANTTQAVQALDDDERSMFKIGRQGEANIINESGLYTLILRTRNATKQGTPQHRFRKWVTSEVLPSIRKNGAYSDTEGKMSTLLGQTIGTDGFHMLGSLIKGKVAHMPAAVQRRATAKLWSQTHAAFGVRSAADIPASMIDSARNFIAAYAIEGEYLEAQALPAKAVEAIHYPEMRKWTEWQEHHLIGNDATYFSDIRRLIKQLHAAKRNGTTLEVTDIANVQYEFMALVHLCEKEGEKKKYAERKLSEVKQVVTSIAESTRNLRAALC